MAGIKGYQFVEGKFEVTNDIKADFDKNGFILIRSLLSKEEVTKIRSHLEKSDVIEQYSQDVADGTERVSRMCLWNHPGDDLTGRLARCHKVATTCEQLLGGEVYHYHTKLMMKEAKKGGRWAWHQDYGYWYKNTCLFPDMMTVFIAMDPCHQENGCLQVMPGSHWCGRLDHVVSGDQAGADPERVQQVQQQCPPVFVELEPGDAIFFHANLLHSSSRNDSDHRRWALAVAFNRASNNPVKEHHHPRYTKLDKVPNSSLLTCGDDWDVANKDFFCPEHRRREQDVLKGRATY